MSYLGDYAEDYATLNFKFTTRTTAGVPFLLAGTPVISVYKANDTTQSTAGVTLTVDFDALTGLNNVLIDLSADAFYTTGTDYHVIITTGTVNGVSVVGEVVAQFSIENRHIDANVVQWLGTVPSSLVANRVNCSVGAMATGTITSGAFAASAIDAVAIAPNAIGASEIAANAIGASQIATDAITNTKIATNAIGSLEIADSGADKIRDAILDRLLSGNHDTSDTPGALLQIIGDSISELAQAAPSTTPTPVKALMLLYMALLDKFDINATFLEIHNNAGTVIAKKALTDDGTTYSEANMETGP